MHIRAAAADDFARVESLVERNGLPTAGLSEQFPRAYAVAVHEGQLLGCGGLEVYDRVGLLRSLAVVEGARRQGIGRALVADRLDAARKARLDAVYLLTTTAGDYFERLGFAAADRGSVLAPLARSLEFAHVCPASARCLAFTL